MNNFNANLKEAKCMKCGNVCDDLVCSYDCYLTLTEQQKYEIWEASHDRLLHKKPQRSQRPD